MTVFYLVRHGDTGVRNKISGRRAGVHLNEAGKEQAQRLAERLAGLKIDALYTSPLERAVETAQPVAAALHLEVQIVDAITEIDYGEWIDKSFEELSADSRWRYFNSCRGDAQIPGGENIRQVQDRFITWMERILRDRSDQRVIAVSHQDPIKCAVMYYLGLHPHMHSRFDIFNASVTAIILTNDGPRILTLNDVGLLGF